MKSRAQMKAFDLKNNFIKSRFLHRDTAILMGVQEGNSKLQTKNRCTETQNFFEIQTADMLEEAHNIRQVKNDFNQQTGGVRNTITTQVPKK